MSIIQPAIFLAIESTNAVLPIPGRAAIIIKSDVANLMLICLTSKPVGIPLKPSLFYNFFNTFLA
jgi:hypothetical protein